MTSTLDDFRKAHDPTYEDDSPVAVFDRKFSKRSRFVITSAQNATPVHPAWWAVLQRVAAERDAELVVIPLRYKNPTSRWVGSQENAEMWPKEVRPYLFNVRRALNKNLTLLGDIKIQPTAETPLTGADALSHASSGIIGHPKVQLRSVATPQNRMAKILTTTGACTVQNYSDTRAGRIGEFHHSLAAVLVETDGSFFSLRHLHFDEKTESCIDLNTLYKADEVGPAPPAAALIMGDTHVDYIDPRVERATFGADGMVAVLAPELLVYHDLLDGYSCNHHHGKNPFNRIAKRRGGTDNVEAEVERAFKFVEDRRTAGTEAVIVPSNHIDFLRRWIIDTDWREDPVNAQFYLRTALMMVERTGMSSKGTDYPDPFTELAKARGLRALALDESLLVRGVELGMHGDTGPNGARGSIKNLRRLGVKSVIGHSHSPGIDEGCYQVGTSTRLRLEYNHGASSWLNTHCVLLANGKRQLINIIDGRWRV